MLFSIVNEISITIIDLTEAGAEAPAPAGEQEKTTTESEVSPTNQSVSTSNDQSLSEAVLSALNSSHTEASSSHFYHKKVCRVYQPIKC